MERIVSAAALLRHLCPIHLGGVSLHAGIDGVFIEITSEGSSPSTSTDAITQTTCDKKLDAAQQILLTADALIRAESWLRDCLTSFSDNRTSRTEITKKSREMKKYLLPMMTQAADP